MKKIMLALVAAAALTAPAHAAGDAVPVTIIEDTASSSDGLVVPIFVLVIIAALAQS